MEISTGILERLKHAVGLTGFTQDLADIAPHLVEWRDRWRGRTPLLLKPQSTAQVSAILQICNETTTPIVAQGGNTGLVGGQIPLNGEILMSLSHLNRIRQIDTANLSAIAEAGVVLRELQRAVDEAGAYFPLSLAAEGTATIGGNISTNAGGVNVLRYGSARRLVLGIEVVLADGRVLDLLRTLRKDNTGYDLKQLFIGAEGTLGVITAVALELFPRLERQETAFIAVPDPGAAVALLRSMEAATSGLLSTFELIPRLGLELVLAHIPGTRDPLVSSSPWYVLMEAASSAVIPLAEIVETAISDALQSGMASDAVLARSESQRSSLWRLREGLSEAQKREGASLKHDVSVPVAAIHEFIAAGSSAVEALLPGARPVPFGHVGDGNIHFNFSVPMHGKSTDFLARRETIARRIHDLAYSYGGSISAEHGLGVAKLDEITRYKSTTELDVMRALKRFLDTNNVLNPGKVIRV